MCLIMGWSSNIKMSADPDRDTAKNEMGLVLQASSMTIIAINNHTTSLVTATMKTYSTDELMA